MEQKQLTATTAAHQQHNSKGKNKHTIVHTVLHMVFSPFVHSGVMHPHRPAPTPIPRAVTSSREDDGGHKKPSTVKRSSKTEQHRTPVKVNEKGTLYKIKLGDETADLMHPGGNKTTHAV